MTAVFILTSLPLGGRRNRADAADLALTVPAMGWQARGMLDVPSVPEYSLD